MITGLVFFILIAALIFQIILILAKMKMNKYFYYVFILSSILLFGETFYRSIKIHFAAVTNIFESLVLFSAFICLLIFFYQKWQKEKTAAQVVFGCTLLNIILLAVASSPLVPKEILPPIPALRSNWLVLHVSFTFIGEAFFTVAFFSSLFFLFSRVEEKKVTLDEITYTLIGIGYPIFTAGALVFGAVWANYAWGSYWSWDPKETWALITWLTYTLYLHLRFIKKKKGRISALLSVIGYAFTLFTFFGVNFLISGLHSYK
jgi:ABC-type transport system involved in cytochrome c biogenesis permease subunit